MSEDKKPAAEESRPAVRREIISITIPNRTWIQLGVFIILVAGILSLWHLIASALLLLLISALLAIALNPAALFLARHLKISRFVAVCVLAVVGLGIAGGLSALIFPPLVKQTTHIANESPHFKEDLLKHKSIARMDRKYHIVDKGSEELSKLPDVLQKDTSLVLTIFFSSIVGMLTIVLLTAFMLLEGEKIVKGVAAIWPGLTTQRWWPLVQDAYTAIGGYVAGTALVALIDGLVIFAALEIFHAPFVLPLALWALLWGVVPIIGGAVGTLPAILVAFTVSPVAGIIVLIASGVYHVIIRAILHPAIVGRAIEMSPFFVFLAILFGDKILGIIGIILAIPVAAIIQIVINDIMQIRGQVVEDVELPSIQKEEA